MSRRRTILLALLGALILGLLALQTPLLRHTRELAWSGLVNIAARIVGIGPLQVDNNVLSQLEGLHIDNIRLHAELQDYRRLRAQLDSPTYEHLRKIDALVAGQPIDTFRTKVVLNRGADDGVTLGAPVITGKGILVGFIVETAEHTALCQLLTNPATSIPAEIGTDEPPRGLLVGRSYTALELTTIPRDAAISAGNSVVTVAHEGTPPGLLIGTIEEVRNEENEAYQHAAVGLPYKPDELRAVSVLVAP